MKTTILVAKTTTRNIIMLFLIALMILVKASCSKSDEPLPEPKPNATGNPDSAAVAADKAALVDASIKGANPDLAHITMPLTNPLPSLGANGSAIVWKSNNVSVISNDGQTIVRPAYGQPNANVTMTATLSKGNVSDSKNFALTVLAITVNPDSVAVAADKAALVDASIKGANPDLAHITMPLTNPLPSLGANGSKITWVSSDTTVVSNDGQTIHGATYGDPDKIVTFTATITKGAVSDTKAFILTVFAEPNSFKITDINWNPGYADFNLCWIEDSTAVDGGYYSGSYDYVSGFNVLGTYMNNTNQSINIFSGTIWYGDGTSESIPYLMAELEPREWDTHRGAFQTITGPLKHKYPAPGTYHIKIEMTADFPEGKITSSFEKDFPFYCKFF